MTDTATRPNSVHDLKIPPGRPRGPILVVADQEPSLLLRHILTASGHETVPASTIDEAVRLLDDARPACSCVIADRDSRLADSVMELLTRVRSFGPVSLAEVPFIVIGTRNTKKFLFWENGVDAYVQRPIHARDLVETVHNVLTRADADRVRHRRDMVDQLSARTY